jgi:hypothetical protein
MFDEAIQQLSQWGGVFVSETPESVFFFLFHFTLVYLNTFFQLQRSALRST